MNGSRSGYVGSLLAVLLLVAFAIGTAGAWPPLVAVESDSMAPGVERGDLVVVTATDRSPWGEGVVGSDEDEPPERLGGSGDVVVFTSPNVPDRPILHRAAFAVTAGEDWTERADPDRVDDDCVELRSCPAPHDGYVTYGDANDGYDQSTGISPVVREEWVHAKALGSIPTLGYVRLGIDAAIARFGLVPATVGIVTIVAGASGVVSVILGRVRDGRRIDRNG
ncbi:signal peptidase [Halorubrum alkaliphilum]|uniref:Signal peptidase n=1 Tax=Halorubrum alkaliphilum TaxID=261290 RepID=A0A8T4GAW6_9EURY|nr:signal peptidase [Halorubrum alkaliphilum]